MAWLIAARKLISNLVADARDVLENVWPMVEASKAESKFSSNNARAVASRGHVGEHEKCRHRIGFDSNAASLVS